MKHMILLVVILFGLFTFINAYTRDNPAHISASLYKVAYTQSYESEYNGFYSLHSA